MKYLLDTNACVDYLNGRHPELTRRFQRTSPADLCISSIVVSELRYGAEKSAHRRRNHERLDVLLEEIQQVDFDAAAAMEYGRNP